ncbi:protein BNI1-like [Limulus polyphemus]|uniref:Protein BNI1-like n=1 Tax=Limulus polyphemus TaxID=6850 RepID=A0ABM1T268_LIMPO|nr:protein BNI1-like [Limulus polyphemus]
MRQQVSPFQPLLVHFSERSTGRGRFPSLAVQEDRNSKKGNGNRKARILIAIGLILPIVAGIIGVVAWAVNADTVLGRNRVNTPFRPTQINGGNTGIGLRPTNPFLENTLESGFGPNPVLTGTIDELPTANLEGDNMTVLTRDFSNNIHSKEVTSNSTSQQKQDDPTMEETSVESPVVDEESSTTLVMNDDPDASGLVTGLIEASGNRDKNSTRAIDFTPSSTVMKNTTTKKTTPQLTENQNDIVQFDDDVDDVTLVKTSALNELEVLEASTLENNQKSSTQTLGPNRSGEHPFVPAEQSKAHNDNGHSGGSQYSYGGYAPPPPSPPPPPPPPPVPFHYPPPAPSYSSNNYGYQAPVPSYYPPEPPKLDHNSHSSYGGGYHESGYGDDYHESGYDRGYDDHAPSKGLSVHIGGGGGSHGGYSPIGSLTSLLLPSLGRPKSNLKGRMVFGVVLDKGVQLGDDKGHGGAYNG